MIGWFGRKPKIANGTIPLEHAPFAGNGRPTLNAEKNVSPLQAPFDRDLYSQALRAKARTSLKAVDDEYERLVRQKAPPDKPHDEDSASIVEDVSKNEKKPDEPRATVIFSPWNIVRANSYAYSSSGILVAQARKQRSKYDVDWSTREATRELSYICL